MMHKFGGMCRILIETRNKTNFCLRELGAQAYTRGCQNNTNMDAAKLYLIILATCCLLIGVKFIKTAVHFRGMS
jgi:hypothetical protein